MPERVYRVTLETPHGICRFTCRENEYLLDAAEGSDAHVPFICRQGRCLTCAGKLIEGSVDQSDADSFYPEDESASFVLLCRAKPRSDLRIRTHQENDMRRHRIKHGLPAPYS